jgi:peptidoglycan biosynthesis protein MviN/MurJ (putative lipid II flippase)
MPQVWFLGTGQRKKILWAAGIDTFLNVTVSLALFPFFGIHGLAWGTVVAFSVEKIVLALWLRKEGIDLDQLIPLKSWVLGSLLLVLSYVFAS